MKETVLRTKNRRVYELFIPAGPDLLRERLIPLHTVGLRHLAKRFGVVPGRASLFRWKKTGYPVDRQGPRVLLASHASMKKAYTSVEALGRFLRVVQILGKEIQHDGGVVHWRKKRKQ